MSQLVGVVSVGAFTFICAFILFFILKATMGIRVSPEEETEGLDIGAEIEQFGHFDPVSFDPTLVGNVRKAAIEAGYSHRNIVSGAGHDACWINRVAPAAMIMCPCVDGLSHNEAESISKEWAAAGTDVLLRAVLETAEIVG